MRETPLTSGELARIPEFVAHWTRIGLSAGPVDRGAAEQAIGRLYVAAGLAAPRILWVPCPMTAILSAIAYTRIRRLAIGDRSVPVQAIEECIYSPLSAAVPVAAQRGIRLGVERAVAAALSLGEAVAVGSDTTAAIDWARAFALEIGDTALQWTLKKSLRALLTEPIRLGIRPLRVLLEPALRRVAAWPYFGAPRWVCTAAELDYLNRVLGVPLDRRFIDTIRSCGLFWAQGGLCFAAERPAYLNWDEAGQLHCEVGPALAYPSGWSWWHWHGIRVPQTVIEAPERITTEAIHAVRGPDRRRVMIERYRWGERVSGITAYLRDAGAELLDRDPAFGTLWRLDVPDAPPWLMVEVENRSPEPDGTYRHFLLRVDPQLRPLRHGGFGPRQLPTARNAVASTFGLNGAEYAPQIET